MIGELVYRSGAPHDGTNVEILRADPVIMVSGPFLRAARLGGYHCVTVVEDLMTVSARNGTWIYRIDRFDTSRGMYRCHWPD